MNYFTRNKYSFIKYKSLNKSRIRIILCISLAEGLIHHLHFNYYSGLIMMCKEAIKNRQEKPVSPYTFSLPVNLIFPGWQISFDFFI